MADRRRDKDVRFITIKGRVVPIKVKKDGDLKIQLKSKTAKKLLETARERPKNPLEKGLKFSERVTGIGAMTTTTAEIVHAVYQRRLKAAQRGIRVAKKQRKVKQFKTFLKITKHHDKVIKFSRKIGIAGVALSAIGIGMKVFENPAKKGK